MKVNIHIANEKERDAAFALRIEVFVNEQNVPPEIELDEEDKTALHIIAEENGEALGCARLILSCGTAHIGRLAVKKACRGKGIGSDICKFAVNYARVRGCDDIWLNSQLHAAEFYEKLGFKREGGIFTEAGIEHIKMIMKRGCKNE